MQDAQMEKLLTSHQVAIMLQKLNYKHIDTNFDDEECTIVFKNKDNKNIIVSLMYQK